VTTALVDLIAAELDERGDAATSLRAEQQVDGYRAWLDTGRDLAALAAELGVDCPNCAGDLVDTGCTAPGCTSTRCRDCNVGCDSETAPLTGRCAAALHQLPLTA
jgi:hypothetical protein